MKKYYTQKFYKDEAENLATWLNSFEEKREGRPNCEYFFEIIDKSVVGYTLFVSIVVYE